MLWFLIAVLSAYNNLPESSQLRDDFAYWGIALIDSFPSANRNGIADCGETLTMVVTVRNNMSTTAYGCSCIVFVDDPYVTIFNDIYYWDDVIPPNRTGIFALDLEIAYNTPLHHLVILESVIYDTMGHFTGFYHSFIVPAPNQIIGEHNLGSLAFTVYPYGSCYDFRFPCDSLGVLPKGSLWVGNTEDFVLDRDYGPNDDWQIDTLNEGYLALGGTHTSDEDARAVFNDSGHQNPKGINVVQQSYNWIDPPFDNFVIVCYLISYSGNLPIDNLYVGQFMNYDIVDSATNFGDTDTLNRVVYMWSDADSFYHGLKLLDPQFISNLSLIDNTEYLVPNSFISDSVKFRFLNGTISLPQTTNPDDYSAIASTGPYTLYPSDTLVVAFAAIGAQGLQEFYVASENAQILYDSLFVSVKENKYTAMSSGGIFTIKSNPVRNKIKIEYTLTKKTKVHLSIYDATGRLVSDIVNEHQKSGSYHRNFDMTDLSHGVYFIRLRTDNKSNVKKAIFLK